nr:immunoglobulin light chain junction region [Macaca mulatta]MOV92185.1 immunoglobulin light chain junction region [Macaca mulatta]MOV92210.1 immunoglobulin light chain junction region [Macaca mulatta]MOV92250.1 immunoglobulin light chain junction region [Macaca mulatta]MOV92262.1 immunoglobulin light chain junction region [Macaca mulatta]
CLQHKNYPLTF